MHHRHPRCSHPHCCRRWPGWLQAPAPPDPRNSSSCTAQHDGTELATASRPASVCVGQRAMLVGHGCMASATCKPHRVLPPLTASRSGCAECTSPALLGHPPCKAQATHDWGRMHAQLTLRLGCITLECSRACHTASPSPHPCLPGAVPPPAALDRPTQLLGRQVTQLAACAPPPLHLPACIECRRQSGEDKTGQHTPMQAQRWP